MIVRAITIGLFAFLFPVLLWFAFNEQYAWHVYHTTMGWHEYSRVMEPKDFIAPYGIYIALLLVLWFTARSLLWRKGGGPYSRGGLVACAVLVLASLGFLGNAWFKERSSEAAQRPFRERVQVTMEKANRTGDPRDREEQYKAMSDPAWPKLSPRRHDTFMYMFAFTCGASVLLFRSLRLPLRWPHGIAAYLAGYFLGLAFMNFTIAAMMLVQMEKPAVLPRILMVGMWECAGWADSLAGLSISQGRSEPGDVGFIFNYWISSNLYGSSDPMICCRTSLARRAWPR
jgi:hypothetical protein